MTREELRRDNHWSWLWCIAVLRERLSGESAQENFHTWASWHDDRH